MVLDFFCFSSIYQLSMLSTLLVTQKAEPVVTHANWLQIVFSCWEAGSELLRRAERGKRGWLRFLFPQLLCFLNFAVSLRWVSIQPSLSLWILQMLLQPLRNLGQIPGYYTIPVVSLHILKNSSNYPLCVCVCVQLLPYQESK